MEEKVMDSRLASCRNCAGGTFRVTFTYRTDSGREVKIVSLECSHCGRVQHIWKSTEVEPAQIEAKS